MLHIVGDRLVHEHGVDVFEEGFDRGRLGFSSRGGETQGSRRCLRRRRRRRRRKKKMVMMMMMMMMIGAHDDT